MEKIQSLKKIPTLLGNMAQITLVISTLVFGYVYGNVTYEEKVSNELQINLAKSTGEITEETKSNVFIEWLQSLPTTPESRRPKNAAKHMPQYLVKNPETKFGMPAAATIFTPESKAHAFWGEKRSDETVTKEDVKTPSHEAPGEPSPDKNLIKYHPRQHTERQVVIAGLHAAGIIQNDLGKICQL